MLAAGTVLQGRYEIRGQLGQGGMGRVYLAADNRLGNLSVAVKEMDASQVAPADRQWTIDAFRHEAQILARLNHVGIARVIDYFSQGDYSYLVMEYVPGEPLDTALARAPRGFDERQALVWAGQLAVVLDYLHQQNPPVIFRDLKPGNIMVQPDGALKLIDFGIARLFKPGQTQDTALMGTPGYAAPEHYGRGQTDARSDIYTLGVVVHQLLTGYDPTLTPMRLPPVRQLRPDVSPQTEAAVAQALQLSPDQRFASAVGFARALGAPLSAPLAAQAMVNVTEVAPMAATERAPAATKPATTGLPGWVKGFLAALALVALLLLGWVLLRGPFGDGGENGQANAAVTEVATFVTQVVTPTPDSSVVEVAATTPEAATTPTPDAGAPQATLAARETELAATVVIMVARETEVAGTANAAVLASAATATAEVATQAAEQMVMIMTRALWDAQTATAEAAPVACSRSPLAQFADEYNRDRLGCPTNGGNSSVWMALQTFDSGVMFWREDTDKIYALYNAGGWARFDDVWLEGDEEFSCGTAESPPTPKRGFGRIWCDHNSVRNGLGNAREAEWGATGATQDFERGTIVVAPNGRTYVLFGDNGTWR
jgi:serine/threonine-protein kinase